MERNRHGRLTCEKGEGILTPVQRVKEIRHLVVRSDYGLSRVTAVAAHDTATYNYPEPETPNLQPSQPLAQH